MKDKTIRNIRFCSYTALAFCAIWAILMIVHFVLLFGGNESIDWSKNSIWKIGLIVSYIVSMIICVLLCAKIVINIFNGLRENTAFPKSNVKLLFWLAVAFFIYLLCWTNEPMLYNVFLFKFTPIVFLIPFCILFFAFMYKVAADAVEENNLTI